MLRVGADMQAGSRGTIDLVLRDADGKAAGGIAVELTVRGLKTRARRSRPKVQ